MGAVISHGIFVRRSEGWSGYWTEKVQWPYRYHAFEVAHPYLMDDRSVPLAGILQNVGEKMNYVYDLGDGWVHIIELEEIVEGDGETTNEVLLLDGAGASPPEDSNGLDDEKGCNAWEQLLKNFKKNPRKVKKDLREIEAMAGFYIRPWAGKPRRLQNPMEFDIEYHRWLLRMMMMIAGTNVKSAGMHTSQRGPFCL